MTKLIKENLRESIRPTLRVNSVARITKEDKNSYFKLVRYDESFDPMGTKIDAAQDRGWAIVSSTDSIQDDRTKDKDESLRQHPVLQKGRGGAQFVLMKIDKELYHKNKVADSKRDSERYTASSTGRKVKKEGHELKITDAEVNEHNIEK